MISTTDVDEAAKQFAPDNFQVVPVPIDRKLSAHDVISEVHRLLQRVDTGRDSYFDTIAQRELMKSIARRVSAAAMLALIEAWLDVATEERKSP